MFYVLALVAVVVSVDILFFRHHFQERLMANVGIVLVFATFGFLIFGRGDSGAGKSNPADRRGSPSRNGRLGGGLRLDFDHVKAGRPAVGAAFHAHAGSGQRA